MSYYDDFGQQVKLGEQLGKGGEGRVFTVVGDEKTVAKIYHQPADIEKSAKIATMVRLRTERLIRLSAWPTATLYDKRGGSVVGFLMPKVTEHKGIHVLYGPKDRLINFPNANWSFIVHSAANIARAFAAIHEHNHVVGDVNQSNIVVSAQATVTLIDCDSFQIVEQGHHFLCDVGVAMYTPPELQGKSFRGIIRTANHDAFGLAILIFQLLFMGRHPFSGQFLGPGEMPLEKAISEYRFAYGTNAALRQMRQPPGSLPLEAVTLPVASLFERAFDRGGTWPNPAEWVQALEQLFKQLRRCDKNSGHDYARGMPICPWCSIEARSGVRLFNIVIAGGWQSGKPFDLELIWAQITAVEAPIDITIPSVSTGTPSPQYVQLGRTRRILAWGGWGGAGGIITLAYMAHTSSLLWWSVGALIVGTVTANSKSGKMEEANMETSIKLKQAQEQYKNLIEQWEREAAKSRFDRALGQLSARRQEYNNLAAEKQQKLQDLEANRQKRQLEKYLDRFRLSNATIPGIGASRTATLASYGIETAADVDWNAISGISGFGPTLTSQLIEWRKNLERKFVFNPNQGVDAADVAAIENDITARRKKIEVDLQQGSELLRQISQQIIAQWEALKPLLMQAAQSLSQAEANSKAL